MANPTLKTEISKAALVTLLQDSEAARARAEKDGQLLRAQLAAATRRQMTHCEGAAHGTPAIWVANALGVAQPRLTRRFAEVVRAISADHGHLRDASALRRLVNGDFTDGCVLGQLIASDHAAMRAPLCAADLAETMRADALEKELKGIAAAQVAL